MSRYTSPGSYSGAFGHASPPPPPPPPVPGTRGGDGKRRSALGAAALVIGLLALLFGWIPVLGLIMLLPAKLAILLGVVGFVAATVTGRTGKLLPFVAALVGVVAFIVPPLSTALFGLAVTPWAYTVGMDQVQIELEHDLKRQGVATEQSERISAEVGDALRSFARPSQWREGIGAAHRFGLITDDYRHALDRLDEDDVAGRAKAAEQFEQELGRLAERYGADLTKADLKLIAAHLGRDIQRSADNVRQWNRRAAQEHRMLYGIHRDGRGRAGAQVWVEDACPAGRCDGQ